MKTAGKCPKCSGEMEVGFLLEFAQGNRGSATQWVSGPPEKSFWMGLKLDARARHDVTTCRCKTCGFLESYAG